MRDPYYSSSPHPLGTPNTFDITMDALNVATLSRSADTDNWKLASRGPLTFGDVTISAAHDDDTARRAAEDWVAGHVERERPDLLED